MNARFYQPSTGRFLSQDTHTGNAYDPWTQHLYSYCGNNPVNMIDPTGHFWYDGNTQYSNDTSPQEVEEQKKDILLKQALEMILEGLNPAGFVLNRMAETCEQNYAEYENDPRIETFVKWATMNGIDLDRMFNNDKPLSLDHWMANINGFLYVYSIYQSGANFAGKGGAASLNGGGISTAPGAAKNAFLDFQSEELLMNHFGRHGAEMGYTSSSTYLQGARDLLNSPVSGSIEGFTSSSGTVFRYNNVTNQFAIGSKFGTISTYFAPEYGMKYWLGEVAKYAPK